MGFGCPPMRRTAESVINTKKKRLTIQLLLFILFIGAIIALTILYAPSITRLVGNPDHFRDFIDSYGALSILVFIGFQVLQVVIAAIPGEFVQIAGGYIFGTVLGTLYSVIGIMIGAVIAFYAARLLGYKVIAALISQAKIDRFSFLLNNKKGEMIVFLLFLIPGLPKDILVYIAGLSPLKPLRFFLIYLSARLPGLVGSSLIGANIQQKNYVLALIIFMVACVLFMVGILSKDLILRKLKGRSDD